MNYIFNIVLDFQFEFVNSFLALFYIAFYLHDMEQLQQVMVTSSLCLLLTTYVAYNNSLRILLNLPSRCTASFMLATSYIKS